MKQRQKIMASIIYNKRCRKGLRIVSLLNIPLSSAFASAYSTLNFEFMHYTQINNESRYQTIMWTQFTNCKSDYGTVFLYKVMCDVCTYM